MRPQRLITIMVFASRARALPGFQRRHILPIATALILLVSPRDSSAILFAFSWSGDPSSDVTIVSATDNTLRAAGTVEIDAAPGSLFTLANILQTDIAVTGDSITDFMFSTWIEAGGSISADGSRAFFSGAGNPYSLETVAMFFGCRSPGCEFNFAIDVSRTEPTTPIAQVVYGSAADALASLRLRAISLPEPGNSAALLLACIALMAAGAGRTRAKRHTR